MGTYTFGHTIICSPAVTPHKMMIILLHSETHFLVGRGGNHHFEDMTFPNSKMKMFAYQIGDEENDYYFFLFSTVACAAARRAIGTRKGEQLT